MSANSQIYFNPKFINKSSSSKIYINPGCINVEKDLPICKPSNLNIHKSQMNKNMPSVSESTYKYAKALPIQLPTVDSMNANKLKGVSTYTKYNMTKHNYFNKCNNNYLKYDHSRYKLNRVTNKSEQKNIVKINNKFIENRNDNPQFVNNIVNKSFRKNKYKLINSQSINQSHKISKDQKKPNFLSKEHIINEGELHRSKTRIVKTPNLKICYAAVKKTSHKSQFIWNCHQNNSAYKKNTPLDLRKPKKIINDGVQTYNITTRLAKLNRYKLVKKKIPNYYKNVILKKEMKKKYGNINKFKINNLSPKKYGNINKFKINNLSPKKSLTLKNESVKNFRVITIDGKLYRSNKTSLKRRSCLINHNGSKENQEKDKCTSKYTKDVKNNIHKSDLKPGALIEIMQLKKMGLLTKRNEFCIFYRKHGYCRRQQNAICPFVHKKENANICKRFLEGDCQLQNCPLSHNYDKNKMPVCSHFVNSSCTKENCPYRHVKVNPLAPVCQMFLRGNCSEKENCMKQHVFLCACAAYEKFGQCSRGKNCPLIHRSIEESQNFKGKNFKIRNKTVKSSKHNEIIGMTLKDDINDSCPRYFDKSKSEQLPNKKTDTSIVSTDIISSINNDNLNFCRTKLPDKLPAFIPL